MLKILQSRFQQCVNQELPDVQAGFRKGRKNRDQIANICWIIEKAKEFQKSIYFCFIDYLKVFDYVDHTKPWKSLKKIRIPDHLTLSPEKPLCRLRSNSYNCTWNNGLAPTWERSTSRLYIVTLFNICPLHHEKFQQAGIKIAGRNITNLRYADENTHGRK